MSKIKVLMLVLLILSPVIIYFLWPTDESRIKKLFREGARAVEEEKIDEVMAKVSFNYSDENGFNYLFIKQGMLRIFRDMSDIKIDYGISSIEVKENLASADLEVRSIATHGKDTGYFLGDAANPVNLKFRLEKVRGKWLVNKTEGMRLPF